MRFAKGHGTENDFVVLVDPDAALDLTPERIAALCDRRAGIGADGVLRAVRTRAAEQSGLLPSGGTGEWFMDYRNADGSIAEMCGNGVRVFARYLAEAGLAETAPPEEGSGAVFSVETRAGSREVRVEEDGHVTVDMGRVRRLGRGGAVLAGRRLSGERISVGNPHLACPVADPVEKVDLDGPPVLDPQEFPEGGNVEVFRILEPGLAEMRVYERGSGETRSCGTGIVAVAAAAEDAAPGNGTWRVRVPGGECSVRFEAAGALLRGPTAIVAEGVAYI